MTYIEKKGSVLNQYFKQYLDYIYPMINLFNYLVPQHKDGILNVTHTMFLCSVIDHFGKIMRTGKLGTDIPIKPGQNEENFRFFIGNYFPACEKCKGGIIYKLFRNGVMHQFFPKSSGIFWSNDIMLHGKLLEEDKITGFLQLNNFVLSHYIRQSLKEIMENFEKDLLVSYIEGIHSNLILKNYGFNDEKVLKDLHDTHGKNGKTLYDPC